MRGQHESTDPKGRCSAGSWGGGLGEGRTVATTVVAPTTITNYVRKFFIGTCRRMLAAARAREGRTVAMSTMGPGAATALKKRFSVILLRAHSMPFHPLCREAHLHDAHAFMTSSQWRLKGDSLCVQRETPRSGGEVEKRSGGKEEKKSGGEGEGKGVW